MDAGSKPPGGRRPRIPPEVDGVQVNVCRVPTCENFGIPSEVETTKRGRPKPGVLSDDPRYKVAASGKGHPSLQCKACGTSTEIKSNLGIVEEIQRVSAYLEPPSTFVGCRTEGCASSGLSLEEHRDRYQRFGRTEAGTRRYRCKSCRKTFTERRPPGSPTEDLAHVHKNRAIFTDLVQRKPMRLICEAAGISPTVLYTRLAFFERQCLAFLAERERRIPSMKIDRLYLAADHQDYLINWKHRNDRRAVQLKSFTVADNATMYVFAADLNYDPRFKPEDVNAHAAEIGDTEVGRALRRYARFWLEGDYARMFRKKPQDETPLPSSLPDPWPEEIPDDEMEQLRLGQAEQDYEAWKASLPPAQRPIPISPLPDSAFEGETEMTAYRRGPVQGMQVEYTYTTNGTVQHLRRLFRSVGKTRWFIDQDGAIRAAIMAAFAKEIRAANCDVFIVSIDKDAVNDKRIKMVAQANALMAAAMRRPEYAGLNKHQIRIRLLRERIEALPRKKPHEDQWVEHPIPTKDQPFKRIKYVTDLGQYDIDHLAALMDKASLKAADQFFMQIRARLSLLDRSVHTTTRAGRLWHRYCPYNPLVVQRLLTIWRAYYNFCKVGQDGKTPAMRLGLAQAPVDLGRLINFRPTPASQTIAA